MTSIATAQIPPSGLLNLDHATHYVPHIDAASSALEKLGFTLTPFSAQVHRPEPGGPMLPAGTGNRCVMFNQGYLEILAPTADTAAASQLRHAITRYTGAHQIAFGTTAPEADHARAAKAGFNPLPPLTLQRQISTGSGEGTARFTIVRLPPDSMPEGRIQFCQQHTPELLWQERWLAHRNGAVALNSVILRVADAQEAAQRFARYSGLLAQVSGTVWRVATARGDLLFLERDTLRRRLDVVPPALPWIAGHILESEDIAATGEYLRRARVRVHVLGNKRLMVKLPSTVGGLIVFQPKNSGVLYFD